jgi:osmoprotectant transport system substrate-binding protein
MDSCLGVILRATHRCLFVAIMLFTSACGGGTDRSTRAPVDDGIVVASFDFAESRLLAEIYAQALEDEGIAVDRQLELGPRELVLPALRQGFVDVVPEYAGSALDAVSPDSSVAPRNIIDVVDELARAVRPWGIDVLAPSSASNQNTLVVTAAFAADGPFHDISDLAPVAASLTAGGPPECPVRRRCLVGLAEDYGIRFGSFVPLDDQELVRRALVEGVIDVGVLFSTDAALAGHDLVVLDDDKRLQPADNVVPVVRRAAVGERAVAVLDQVSAELTTTNLRFLNWRVAYAGTDAAAEARAWLIRHGLVSR